MKIKQRKQLLKLATNKEIQGKALRIAIIHIEKPYLTNKEIMNELDIKSFGNFFNYKTKLINLGFTFNESAEKSKQDKTEFELGSVCGGGSF
jgi:hypothetical protein